MPRHNPRGGRSRGGGRRGRGGRGRGRGRGRGQDSNAMETSGGSSDRYNPYGGSKQGGGGGGDYGGGGGDAWLVSIFNVGDASKGKLHGFLANLCGPFSAPTFDLKHGKAYITFDSKEDADKLLEANTANFNGKKLSIRVSKKKGGGPKDDGGGGRGQKALPMSQEGKRAIHHCVQSHYNKECFVDGVRVPMLDLGSIRDKLPGVKVNFDDPNFASTLFEAIARCSDVQTINFGNCGIRHLRSFSKLQDYAGSACRLGFADNEIRDVRELDGITGLDHLVELILTGNPIARGNPVQMLEYRSEVSRRFPNLILLDETPVQPSIKFDVPDISTASLPEVERNFADCKPTELLAVAFVSRYFQCYDQERQKIGPAYHPKCSCFSVTTDEGDRNSVYSQSNRNLNVAVTLGQRDKLLTWQAVHISSLLNNMPGTSHDLEKISMDAVRLSGGLDMISITVNGPFWCDEQKCNRQFSRTFTVMPPPPGSPAASDGWPCVIVSDMLNIWKFEAVYQPQKPHASPHLGGLGGGGPALGGPSSIMGGSGPSLLSTPSNEQQMIQQLANQCNITFDVARDALIHHEGNMAAALSHIEMLQARGEL